MDRLKIILALMICCSLQTAVIFAKSTVENNEPNKADYSKLIEQGKLKEDLDFLFKTIEEVHPNMYAYTSKEEFTPLREGLYRQIYRPMTRLNFLKLVAPTIAQLKCA